MRFVFCFLTLALLVLVALAGASPAVAAGPGFRAPRLLDEHYEKHGKEFGDISRQQYLKMAQQLRDARLGHDVLEAKRPDGGGAKFEVRKGWFVAYDADGTIRTFFIPNDGIKYFYRQMQNYAGR